MMRKMILIILAFLASPALAFEPQSLQSRESLRAAVDQYVQAHLAEQAAATAAAATAPNLAAILEGTAQDGDRSELAALEKLIDASLDRHEKKDWSNEALQRELARLTNGGRTSDQILTKLGVTSDRVAGAGKAIHSEMVSWLVARYYDRPEERDALFALMTKFSEEIQPEVKSRNRDVDNLISYLGTGTSIGLTVIMIIDFRQHIYNFGKAISGQGVEAWQGLQAWTRGGGPRRAAQGAVDGIKSTVGSLRGRARPTSILGLEYGTEARLAEQLERERKAVAGSQSALTRLENDTQRAVEQLGREGQALVPANPLAMTVSIATRESALERTRRLIQGGQEAAAAAAQAARREAPTAVRRSVHYMRQLAAQVAKGFLIGGIPYGIYALNEQSEAAKVDPLEVLKVFQLFALMEIEIEGSHLAEEARKLVEALRQPRLTEAKRKEARAKLKDLAAGYEITAGEGKTRHVLGLTDLRSQFEHLKAHATRFRGLTQYPNTMREIAAYRSKLSALKLLQWKEERVTAFLAASKELEDRVATVDEKIRAEAAARGFAPGAQLAASLAAADLQLQAAEEALRALDELAKPATARK